MGEMTILKSSENNAVKLSIIMPCYNVEQTLERALSSVVRQKVDFAYEILIVDDASTDATLQLAKKWQEKHPQIRVLTNIQNKGNAYSYYTALCASVGEYFCVLDGDDYYTVSDKLQRQVDFLDHDTTKEYVGVATDYIVDLENEKVYVPPRSKLKEYNYTDFLTQRADYHHTATYMYRNVFRGNVPEEFSDILYRGDTPRTTFHLKYTGKKIRVLDFVGSAYVFAGNGLWSSMKETQQYRYQIDYQSEQKKRATTEFERNSIQKTIQHYTDALSNASDSLRRYPEMTLDEVLLSIQEKAQKFAFEQKDYVLEKAYYSPYIDSLLESIGYIQRVYHPAYHQATTNSARVAIIEGILNPTGGGIFAEIEQLIDAFKEKSVYLFVTNMQEIPPQTSQILQKHSNLTLVCPPQEVTSRLDWYRKKFIEISPARCYCYCSHHDVIGPALIERGVCENLALFSFDHGYLCGISNSSLNTLIAKRSVDYYLLSESFPQKDICMIPAWSGGVTDCEGISYTPFAQHERLTTASGAARFYKVDGRPPFRYLDMVLQLLQKTGGRHYHFGPIPDEIAQEIKKKLREMELPEDCFIHIPWAENLPKVLLQKHVDIFIEPFPVVSYKISMDVLSAGIPIIAKKSLHRMETTDFLPPDSLFWESAEEFISLLGSLKKGKLEILSQQAKHYFEENHSKQVIENYIRKNEGMMPKEEFRSAFLDDRILDIAESLSLFGESFNFVIQEPVSAIESKSWKGRMKDIIKQTFKGTPLYNPLKQIYKRLKGEIEQ